MDNVWCGQSCWGELGRPIFKWSRQCESPYIRQWRRKTHDGGNCHKLSHEHYQGDVCWTRMNRYRVLTYTFPSTISYSSVSATTRPETVAVAFPFTIVLDFPASAFVVELICGMFLWCCEVEMIEDDGRSRHEIMRGNVTLRHFALSLKGITNNFLDTYPI